MTVQQMLNACSCSYNDWASYSHTHTHTHTHISVTNRIIRHYPNSGEAIVHRPMAFNRWLECVSCFTVSNYFNRRHLSRFRCFTTVLTNSTAKIQLHWTMHKIKSGQQWHLNPLTQTDTETGCTLQHHLSTASLLTTAGKTVEST